MTKLKIVLPIIAALSFGYYYEFIKGKPIIDAKQVSICITDNHLQVEVAEAVKYFSSVKTITLNDTLHVKVKETTIFNIFSNKKISAIFILPSNIKYITICNKTTPVLLLEHCRF
ncbi:hypothetical protein [Mucilaginibacter sp.]|uniref:hypothetical protein n=1 Tax=Mucilaginibacter sp. TaxID=1882438 RepID=UPI003D0DD752